MIEFWGIIFTVFKVSFLSLAAVKDGKIIVTMTQ